MDKTTHDIVSMPLGGPDASWLNWRLQTDRPEYLDRDDVDDLKRKPSAHSTAADGDGFSVLTRGFARVALGEVADVPS